MFRLPLDVWQALRATSVVLTNCALPRWRSGMIWKKGRYKWIGPDPIIPRSSMGRSFDVAFVCPATITNAKFFNPTQVAFLDMCGEVCPSDSSLGESCLPSDRSRGVDFACNQKCANLRLTRNVNQVRYSCCMVAMRLLGLGYETQGYHAGTHVCTPIRGKFPIGSKPFGFGSQTCGQFRHQLPMLHFFGSQVRKKGCL